MPSDGESFQQPNTVVTSEGIEQAIHSLSCRSERSPKYRLVDALRRAHTAGERRGMGNDDLIRILWDTAVHGAALASRRRNLSSLRSSVNADLMALYRKGDNPEGLIISPDNTFVICDEAKDQALEAFRSLTGMGDGAPDLTTIGDVLRDIRAMLEEAKEGGGNEPGAAVTAEKSLKEAIRGLAVQVGVRVMEGAVGLDRPGPGGQADPGRGSAGEEGGCEGPVDDMAGPEILEMEEAAEEDLEEAEAELVEVVEDEEGDGGLADADKGDLKDEAWSGEPADGLLDGWDGLDKEWTQGTVDSARAGLLAEEFNRSLAAMDRFYNQYILVPGGAYPVSSGPTESRVDVEAFYVGRFPVTNALFEVFVERTGYRTTAERSGYGTVYQGRFRRKMDDSNGRESLHISSGMVCTRMEGACWYHPSGPGSSLRNRRNHPVVQVSLEDAMAFAAWSGKRLPEEEEWEAAMRTPEGRRFPWGDEWDREACNVEESCIGGTTNVDRYEAFANSLGVADGLGNVMEWTLSREAGSGGAARRVARSTSWISGGGTTLSNRTVIDRNERSNALGFRCVAV